ncbi:TetR/AcrR family transcriptional regulator [Polymorphobacter arshaanensis]|uniref:TetR/AcrR family transcriptional regulator n=1 Tax=Glacieibacterium arshaanense TaxID=2511025 RepID=A0A4Y9ERM0_9SPHN|nr:TetR/AcrR family transcriptional regulator [Polymorphobacter arshaanensis]TFU06287.1 TetR/AcrR family transcriptional regulator [Polymorphobacter arshaanensis]
MGHSKAEKAQSRERILAAAATKIRESGLDGISVGDLMKSVNLTHGGFYGHFESRAHLIAAALEQALADGEKASAAYAGKNGSITVKSIVNSYLSPAHRDHPSSGCAIPTLAGEVSRADPEVRAVMAQQLVKSFDAMGEALGESGQDTEQFAVSAWSMMVGAMMISRILGDDPLADRVLALTRKSILELAALHDGHKN